MGIPPEDDAIWAELMNATLGRRRPRPQPGRRRGSDRNATVPEIFERCGKMIAARRENPTDDLTSVLVHAEVDGEKLEEHEIVMGFFLLVAAGNDCTKATYCSGMRALMEHPEQMPDAPRRPVADPQRGRGGAADVPRLRPLPPHRDPRHRAQRAADQRGRQGGHLVRRRPTATRRATRTPTASTSPATPSTRPSAPAAATSASAPRWPGSSCKILFEETLARYPEMTLAGSPMFVESAFLNQLKTLPVRLAA